MRSRITARQANTFNRRKRERKILLSGFIVAVVVGGVFGLSKISGLPFMTIQVVEVIGADPDIAAGLRAASSEALEGDYLHLFPRNNVFLYPRGAIAKMVKTISPRVDSVEVKRNSWNSLLVRVKEKEPAALVCATFPDFEGGSLAFGDNDQCLFADRYGLLFERAPSISGTLYNRYYIPTLTDRATTSASLLGILATSTREFETLQEFYTGLLKNGIEVQAVLLKEKGEYEAYVRNPREGTAVIYFNNARPLSIQLANLLLFWGHALEQGRKVKMMPRYESIDVRYGANVFFR